MEGALEGGDLAVDLADLVGGQVVEEGRLEVGRPMNLLSHSLSCGQEKNLVSLTLLLKR